MKRILLGALVWLAGAGIAFAAVNINTATKDELMTLNGIGESKAQAIIDYRTKNGPFKKLEDIDMVPGIGEGIFKKIKGDISLTGETKVKVAKKDDKGKKEEKSAMKEEKAKGNEMKATPATPATPPSKTDDKKAMPATPASSATEKKADEKGKK